MPTLTPPRGLPITSSNRPRTQRHTKPGRLRRYALRKEAAALATWLLNPPPPRAAEPGTRTLNRLLDEGGRP